MPRPHHPSSVATQRADFRRLRGYYEPLRLPDGPATPSRVAGCDARPHGRNHAAPSRASRVACALLCVHADATTPARPRSPIARASPSRQEALASRRRPSPSKNWVGSRILLFEACSAFTRVSACTLAESLTDPLTSECSCNKNPSCRSDCYRLERPSCRVGLSPTTKRHSSRRTLRAE